METGKNTSADRNRKQTGKSEEIVADSAICTCDKGSKPGTFRVTSQQKVYCNGARKLVATDQDKDIKSLNFGSCAAKNNGPCSPNIVWSNTYNKIAIKGKMYPLTVKSSGTCKAGGGRINIQTSGQQVVVKPSSSPRKANSTAHKSPIFTEEDWKHLPQEDEKSQNKRVPAAVQVNNVLVNGKREITITPYDHEELLFTTSLTAGSVRGTGVKWDVCHGNRVIAKGLTEAPARTYFTKEGTYSVYAYVHKPGSPKGKGVIRITVSYPKFKSIEWKDENGKPVTYIGLRNKVFAHVSLPGCKGISVNCRFYYNGYEGKTYLSALTPIPLSAAGKVKIALSLSSDQLKKIIEDRKRFSNGQKIRIYLELSSRHWIENLTKASQHPILFNDKIEFRSIVIYKDSDCKEKLQGGIADSGSTVYVRVSTSNIEIGKIRLDVYKHETSASKEKSSEPSPVYSTSCPVNSTGVYKFSLTLAAPPYKEGTAYKVVVLWDKDYHLYNAYKLSINATKLLRKEKLTNLLIRRQILKQQEKKSKITKQETTPPVNNDCVCKQYDLVYGRKVSCAFRKKVVLISKELGLPQEKYEGANWLMTVMALETNKSFNPAIQNGAGYTGLIQFGANAASRLGTTTSHLKKMKDIEQLTYVEKYFSLPEYKNKLKTLTDVYLAVLWPNACGHGDDPNYIVLKDKYYRSNPLFFKEKDENLKDSHGKRIYKTNGVTYVWEIRKVLESIYIEGKKCKELQFQECFPGNSDSLSSNKKIVTFADNLSQERRNVVSSKTIHILEQAALKTSNNKVVITSTIRSSRQQAQAMYDNEESGRHLKYTSAGQAVINVYKEGKHKRLSKGNIVQNMDERIKKFMTQGIRVSRHAVSVETYAKNNIIDISYSAGNLKNAKAFILELLKDNSVSKIIEPLYSVNSMGNPGKLQYDKAEPAIHVEIKQKEEI